MNNLQSTFWKRFAINLVSGLLILAAFVIVDRMFLVEVAQTASEYDDLLLVASALLLVTASAFGGYVIYVGSKSKSNDISKKA